MKRFGIVASFDVRLWCTVLVNLCVAVRILFCIMAVSKIWTDGCSCGFSVVHEFMAEFFMFCVLLYFCIAEYSCRRQLREESIHLRLCENG